jgi:hypothetical protein
VRIEGVGYLLIVFCDLPERGLKSRPHAKAAIDEKPPAFGLLQQQDLAARDLFICVDHETPHFLV